MDLKRMLWKDLYRLYLNKIERKQRTGAELDRVIIWLTGYSTGELERASSENLDLETFLEKASLNEKRSLVTGSVCGVKVQDLEAGFLKEIRILDKLVDELAKGKAIDEIIRS